VITLLEKMAKKEEEKPTEEEKTETEEAPPMRGWRRFLPF